LLTSGRVVVAGAIVKKSLSPDRSVELGGVVQESIITQGGAAVR
jgi:hypothetical protein